MQGRILKGVAGTYTVLSGGVQYLLRAQNKLRRQKMTPMVGDLVEFTPGEGDQDGWLEAILPRWNQLARPPVSNIDAAGIVLTPVLPAPDLLLADKLLLSTRLAGIAPAIVINKADLDPEGAEAIAREYAGIGAPVLPMSAASGQGVSALGDLFAGQVFALSGQSGVGKSTIINALYGFSLQTGELSRKAERGKHTTRHSELIPLPGGGMALDTPGFSLMELKLMDPGGIAELMPEFESYAGMCRFNPCTHRSEPGCAVRLAAEAGEISPVRWSRYCAIYNEMDERWRNRYG